MECLLSIWKLKYRSLRRTRRWGSLFLCRLWGLFWFRVVTVNRLLFCLNLIWLIVNPGFGCPCQSGHNLRFYLLFIMEDFIDNLLDNNVLTLNLFLEKFFKALLGVVHFGQAINGCFSFKFVKFFACVLSEFFYFCPHRDYCTRKLYNYIVI